MIVDRIRKLLNLAHDKGASEHEAARALELATELMLKHGIEAKDLDNEVRIGEGSTFELDGRWHSICAQAVGVLYGTLPLHYSTGFNFVGRQDNVEACEVTFAYIVLQVTEIYKQSLPKGLSKAERNEFRRTFKEGCALRVFHRAHEIISAFEKRGTSECTALAVIDHRKALAAEAAEFAQQHLGAKVKTSEMVIRGSNGSQLGYAAGERVRLSREIILQ